MNVMQDKEEQEAVREVKLDPDHEFRFEVEFNSKVQIKLIKGTAEIFGTELAAGVTYTFSGRKAAVYTWHGCTLEIKGVFSVEYTANETPMTSYLNTHLALEQLREKARSEKSQGPRVLVIGPHDVGKTSLSKILVSYSLRQGGSPIYVSLDTAEGAITMPGTITATCISNIIDVEEGFGSSATTAASMGSSTMPLAYYYGYESPSENVKLYKLISTKLAEAIKKRMQVDEECASSGFIIDTAGLIDHVGYDIIQHIIETFAVNVVIVLGHERLYSDMNRILSTKADISVVKLSKSGGVVERDRRFKTNLQRAKIHEYFYGTPKCELSPYSMLVSYDDLKVWRVGDVIAPSSALPLGMDSSSNETQVIKVDNFDMCLHSILSILNIDETESESQILESNVAGFIYISDVDEEKRKVTVLSPSPGRLPKKHILMGSFKWMES